MGVNSVEANLVTMRFIVESNDARTFDVYTDRLTENFIGHNHFVPGDLHGNTSLGYFFYLTEEVAFPDGNHIIEHLYGEGDYVTLVLSFTGTFTGPLPDGTKPNGKVITFKYNILCRFEGDKLAELWWYEPDSHSLMKELGMI